MLETLRRNSRSTVLYVLFGFLIAAFVISLGQGFSGDGCTAKMLSSDYAIYVNGHEISQKEYRADVQIKLRQAQNEIQSRKELLKMYGPDQLRQYGINPDQPDEPSWVMLQRAQKQVLDQLIERELYVSEAEKLGLLVSEQEASNDLVKALHTNQAKKIEYKDIENSAQSLGLTVKEYVMFHARGLLQQKLRQLMLAQQAVSIEEVKQAFADSQTKVKLEYVKFKITDAPARSVPTAEELTAFATSHDALLRKTYGDHPERFQNQEKMVRLRRLLVPVKKDADATAQKAAQDAVNRIRGSFQKNISFEKVLAGFSQENPKPQEELLSWRKKGGTELPESLEAKVFSGNMGDVLGPERTDEGYVWVKVEAFREGNIAFDAVRLELAEEIYPTETAKIWAKGAAQKVVEQLKAGSTLATLFPKAAPKTDAEEAKAKPLDKKTKQVEETGLVAREGERVGELGASQDLARFAFTQKPGAFLGPIELQGDHVVVSIKERAEPDWKQFDKEREKLAKTLREQKFQMTSQAWAQQKCLDAKAMGQVKVSSDALSFSAQVQDEDPEAPVPFTYEPCSKNNGLMPQSMFSM